MQENGIRHFQIHIPGNKDTANISTEHIASALTVVLDRRNLPILIHCNKGKVSGLHHLSWRWTFRLIAVTLSIERDVS